jgi:hypothetical protein
MKFMKSLSPVAARRRGCCRHLIVGCTGIRARRLRSQLPSQCVWPMRMGRSKSKLVPENYGPSRHLRGRWKVALLQVIRQSWHGARAENVKACAPSQAACRALFERAGGREPADGGGIQDIGPRTFCVSPLGRAGKPKFD